MPELNLPTPPVPYAGGASNGVAVAVPPEYILPSITAAVNKAAEAIPAGKTGALVAIATPKGTNLAVVSKVGDHVKVTAWIGRTWVPKPGEAPWEYGCAATVVW